MSNLLTVNNLTLATADKVLVEVQRKRLLKNIEVKENERCKLSVRLV